VFQTALDVDCRNENQKAIAWCRTAATCYSGTGHFRELWRGAVRQQHSAQERGTSEGCGVVPYGSNILHTNGELKKAGVVPYGGNMLHKNEALQKDVTLSRIETTFCTRTGHFGRLWGGALRQQHATQKGDTFYRRDVAILLTALPWQQTRECNSNVEVKQKIALLGWRGGWTIACRPVGNKNMTWPMYIQRQFEVITYSHPTLASHYFLQQQLLLLMQPVYEYTCVRA
jgi:hypothetical protein